MNAEAEAPGRTVGRFHFRILAGTLLVVGALTALGALFAHRQLALGAGRELEAVIDQQMEGALRVRALRESVLAGICGRLARLPRIHAALEDDALDLLYPSARNELRFLIDGQVSSGGTEVPIQAVFYRFLDAGGHVIPTQGDDAAGDLPTGIEAALALPGVPDTREHGFFIVPGEAGDAEAVEVFAAPIVSTVTWRPIATLVVGFPAQPQPGDGLATGIWTGGALAMDGVDAATRARLGALLATNARRGSTPPRTLDIRGVPHRVDTRVLNSGSPYPPAHEVFLSSMASLAERQTRSLRQILRAGAVLFLTGALLSYPLARRLARPVHALARASAEEHTQRLLTEARLNSATRELDRAARFSADASHQLKTPVSVMRAGLELLLGDPRLARRHRSELEGLIRQTQRLTKVIDDLLLLSRIDAGRLRLTLRPHRLSALLEPLLDDFSILPDWEALSREVVLEPGLEVRCDLGYASIILQAILENALKYNRGGGRIRIAGFASGLFVTLRVGNTGASIPEPAQPHIFDRFHRGASGENIAGYGLGLSLARDLARLHGGDLQLAVSIDDWTEFNLSLPAAKAEGNFPATHSVAGPGVHNTDGGNA